MLHRHIAMAAAPYRRRRRLGLWALCGIGEEDILLIAANQPQRSRQSRPCAARRAAVGAKRRAFTDGGAEAKRTLEQAKSLKSGYSGSNLRLLKG